MDIKIANGKMDIINISPDNGDSEEFFPERKKNKRKIYSTWLLSFTDVMALMLTFFVLMFSMSEPKEKEWSEVTAALNEELGTFLSNPHEQGMMDSINIGRIELNQALDLIYLRSVLKQTLSKEELLKDVSLITQYDSLIISLPENLLFKAGSSELTDDGKNAVYALAGLLSKLGNRIEIIGQADPRPLSQNSKYNSNWDLSLVRAMEVASTLEKRGYDRNIRVIGLSSGRYDELPESWSEKDRQNLSRRVDIAVMEDDGSKIKYYNDKLLIK